MEGGNVPSPSALREQTPPQPFCSDNPGEEALARRQLIEQMVTRVIIIFIVFLNFPGCVGVLLSWYRCLAGWPMLHLHVCSAHLNVCTPLCCNKECFKILLYILLLFKRVRFYQCAVVRDRHSTHPSRIFFPHFVLDPSCCVLF